MAEYPWPLPKGTIVQQHLGWAQREWSRDYEVSYHRAQPGIPENGWVDEQICCCMIVDSDNSDAMMLNFYEAALYDGSVRVVKIFQDVVGGGSILRNGPPIGRRSGRNLGL